MVPSRFRKEYRHNEISTSGQGKLIVMMYEGAVKFVNLAIEGVDKKDLAKRKNCPARHQFSRRAVTAFSIELLRDSAATPLQSAELQVAQARRGRSLHIGCIARRAPGAIKTDNVSFWSARS